MIKKWIMILLMVIVLFGCQKKIEPPQNLKIDNNQVTWESIDAADYYILSYNDKTIELEENSYSLSNLTIGSYTFKVKVVINDQESRFSVPLEHLLIYEVPFDNITLTDNMLSWTHIATDVTYRIKIEYGTTKIENSFDIASYELPSTTEDFIKIDLLSYLDNQLVSAISLNVDMRTYQHFDSTQDTILYDVDDVQDIYIDGLLLNEEYYTYSTHQLSIDGSYLSTLQVGHHNIFIKGEESYILNIEVKQIDKPHIVSHVEISYQGQDIIVEFEVYEGYIDLLGGLDIEDNDYSISGNTLTIKSSYINRIISNEPERTMLVLGYTLVNGPYTVYGNLFISIEN